MKIFSDKNLTPVTLLNIVATLIFVVAAAISRPSNFSPAKVSAFETNKKVVGYIGWWDQERAKNTISNNLDIVTEISPWWYRIEPDGSIVVHNPDVIDQTLIDLARSNGIAVIPAISNQNSAGAWDAQMTSSLIGDPTLMQAHINNIVDLAVSNNYDGIDIDYEHMNGSDRDNFSNFITQLANALHAENKLLTVAVHPKTSSPGTWGAVLAQDWQAIGQSADELRIMIYDYSWDTSPPGAVSPLLWNQQVIDFALTRVAPEKIIHGMATYGYDWPNNQAATSAMWQELINTATANSSAIQFDPTTQSPTFTYSHSGIDHQVWFENNQSISLKLDITATRNLAGVHLWRLGGEDPSIWDSIRVSLGKVASSPSPSPDTSSTPTLPCLGDINQDKKVNLLDYRLLASDFLKTVFASPGSDINSDGRVNIFDFSILVSNFDKICSG